MQSFLDLKAIPKGTSHHQLIQQVLQVLQEGLVVGCNSDIGKRMTRMVARVTRRMPKTVDHCIEHILLLLLLLGLFHSVICE